MHRDGSCALDPDNSTGQLWDYMAAGTVHVVKMHLVVGLKMVR